jgi:hypothetical protein
VSALAVDGVEPVVRGFVVAVLASQVQEALDIQVGLCEHGVDFLISTQDVASVLVGAKVDC